MRKLLFHHGLYQDTRWKKELSHGHPGHERPDSATALWVRPRRFGGRHGGDPAETQVRRHHPAANAHLHGAEASRAQAGRFPADRPPVRGRGLQGGHPRTLQRRTGGLPAGGPGSRRRTSAHGDDRAPHLAPGLYRHLPGRRHHRGPARRLRRALPGLRRHRRVRPRGPEEPPRSPCPPGR
jgi:hypothetical protein